MKPLPPPNVPGSTEWERFDNAVRMAFRVKPEAIQKERERMDAERAKKKRAKKKGCMNSWYSISMSSKDVAEGKHFPLNTKFQQLFMDARSPLDGAMFTRNDTFGCEYLLSPAAAAFSLPLLLEYGGVPCAAPKRSETRLLAGHSGSEHVPFAAE